MKVNSQEKPRKLEKQKQQGRGCPPSYQRNYKATIIK